MWPKWTRNNSKPKATKPQATASAADPVNPVAAYKEWVASADVLDDARASQVVDPLSNPDTVNHLRQRSRQTSLAEIDAQHRQRMHDLATADRWRRVDTEAAESEINYRLRQRDRAMDRIQRIDAARAAHDPATAAADEVRASTLRVRRYLVIAWVMSALAATGIAASMWLSGWSMAMSIGTGLAAEIGLTYLASSIIADQSAMSRRIGLARDAEGTRIDVDMPRWTRILPWSAVGGLLTASISVNVYGLVVVGTGELGYLGAIAAVVAALSTLLAWGHARQSSAIVAALLSDASIQSGENALDEIASGARIPRRVTTATVMDRDAVLDAIAADPTLIDAAVSEAADRAIIQAPLPPAPADDDTDGGAVAVAERPAQLDEGARKRAEIGAINREKVRALYDQLKANTGKPPSKTELARRTGLDRRTIGRHLDD